MSVPYGSNTPSGGRMRLFRQLPGFLWLLLEMLASGLWQTLRPGPG
jgi:hypothetical protein